MRTNTCCTLDKKNLPSARYLALTTTFPAINLLQLPSLVKANLWGETKTFTILFPFFLRKLKNLNQFPDSNHEMYYAEMVRALALARR